jgi:hypothetical protein
VSNADRPPDLLSSLSDAGIEFIVVGGMAGVLQGVSVVTIDLDIVHNRLAANVERLHSLLVRLDAHHRGQPRGRILGPTPEELSGSGHLNLVTSLGPLDVLCELDPGVGYEELVADAVELTDGEKTIRVLGLRRLVEIKSRSKRAKDRVMLPLLLAALAEQESSEC